jgi:hypothetical protein
MFAQTPCVSFDRPFSKGRGCGQRPRKTPFLFANFFFAAPSCKEKVAMDVEKPRGYSRLASASSLPAFSFDERCAKEKAIKKKTLVYGALPQTPRAFEKARQNFTTKVCANKATNQNLNISTTHFIHNKKQEKTFKSFFSCFI